MKIVQGLPVVAWVYKTTLDPVSWDFNRTHRVPWGIGIEDEGGQLVAGVVYDSYTGSNVFLHVASVPGHNWLLKRPLAAFFGYPFLVMGVRRVTAAVRDDNKSVIRLIAHLGFSFEARLQGAHPAGDVLLWRMMREDCRWITPSFLKRADPERFEHERLRFSSSAA